MEAEGLGRDCTPFHTLFAFRIMSHLPGWDGGAVLASASPIIRVLCRMRVLHACISINYSIFWPNGKLFCFCVHTVWTTSQQIVNGPWPWLGAGSVLGTDSGIINVYSAAKCTGHHTSSIVQGLLCLYWVELEGNISIIAGISHHAAPLGQYFLCWERAGVPCSPQHPFQGCSMFPEMFNGSHCSPTLPCSAGLGRASSVDMTSGAVVQQMCLGWRYVLGFGAVCVLLDHCLQALEGVWVHIQWIQCLHTDLCAHCKGLHLPASWAFSHTAQHMAIRFRALHSGYLNVLCWTAFPRFWSM